VVEVSITVPGGDLGADRTGGVEMRRSSGRATTGYGRTAIVALASMGLLVGTWGSASGLTSAATVPFDNGTAKATAVVARVAPGVGSLQLGISSGVAVSQIQNTVASSQAEALDLGLLGSTLTAANCHGGAGVVKASELPMPVTVDSRKGASSGSADEYPLAGTTLGGGHKEAQASPNPPSSSALATLVGSSIPGLLSIGGGRSVASTKVVDGNAREAHATVDVDLTIAGLLKLQGMTWDAFHRTGKDPKATASFDIGTGTLLGLPIPTQSLQATETAINNALAYTGISITFPRVERFTTPADLVRMTPMRIVLQDTPAGKAVLGPVLNLTRAQREQLFTQLTSAICDTAAALLVGDIGLDVASGTGFIAVEIGGAEATSGDLFLQDPFGKGTPPPESAIPGLPLPATIPSYLPLLIQPAIAPVAAAQRAASIGPLTDKCESAHPKHPTACSKGELLAVGLVGFLATAAVGGLDWRHQRRRRARLTPSGGAPA
jgi:hypothetical protein